MQHYHRLAPAFVYEVLANSCVVMEMTLKRKKVAKRLGTHRQFKFRLRFKPERLLALKRG